jgi:hypothetical protein
VNEVCKKKKKKKMKLGKIGGLHNEVTGNTSMQKGDAIMTLMIKTCQEYDSFMCLNMNVFKV